MRRRNGNYSIGNKKFKPTELHGQRFYDWFDKAFNLQQENPSDSTSHPAINKADRVCPVEIHPAGISLVSHASAPFLNKSLPHFRCALAHSLWDDVESDSDIDGKDNRHAWQPKTGSSPIHPLSAGAKSMTVENRNTLEPETTMQMCNPADFNEEPASVFAPGAALLSQHHYSHCVPRTGEQPRSGCFDMRLAQVYPQTNDMLAPSSPHLNG